MPTVDRSTRLANVTFCVLDLETTGTSDEIHEIVEVGAVLVRGGDQLGSFQTMVRHPLASGPAEVPALPAVLASLLEFVRGSVIVGHNVRFDLRFLNAALWKTNRDVVLDPAEAVDTVPLARRLLGDDADDCRLGTLAERFEFGTQPTHRALADAQATVELLHLIIERATHYGALDLDDLMRLPALMRHPWRSRLAATARLPRVAGVARLLDRRDQTIHVVVADDLRHEVRRLFHSDDRSPQSLPAAALRHLHRVEGLQTHHPIVARVAALRWSTSIVRSRSASAAYLQVSKRTGRVRVVAESVPPVVAVVAGPMSRPLATQVVARLAGQPSETTARFLAALTTSECDDNPFVDDDVVTAVIHRHRSLCRGSLFVGTIQVDGATVAVARGRVRDVVVGGRSFADDLPPYERNAPGMTMTSGSAEEALLVAELLAAAQPCEILET